MAEVPQFVLDKALLLQLTEAMEKASLEVRQFSPPQRTAEGIEQLWMCCDKSGQLFSFSTIEVHENNVLGLKVGVVGLVIGPCEKSELMKHTRQEVKAAFERFEQVLIVLGAQRMK